MFASPDWTWIAFTLDLHWTHYNFNLTPTTVCSILPEFLDLLLLVDLAENDCWQTGPFIIIFAPAN
jgi:hypothetical protein